MGGGPDVATTSGPKRRSSTRRPLKFTRPSRIGSAPGERTPVHGVRRLYRRHRSSEERRLRLWPALCSASHRGLLAHPHKRQRGHHPVGPSTQWGQRQRGGRRVCKERGHRWRRPQGRTATRLPSPKSRYRDQVLRDGGADLGTRESRTTDPLRDEAYAAPSSAGRGRPSPAALTAPVYHPETRSHLLRIKKTDTSECWWCASGEAQSRYHLFTCCRA